MSGAAAVRKRGRAALGGVCLALVAVLAMAFLAASAQAATPAWKVMAVVGPTNMAPYTSVQKTVFVPTQGAGTFTLTFGASTTPSLPRNSSRGAIEAALSALPSIAGSGGQVSIDQIEPSQVNFVGPINAFRVTFGGALADTTEALTATTTGGTAVTVARTVSGSIVVNPTNVGGASTNGSPITVGIDLPAGVTPLPAAADMGASAECVPAGQHVTCSRSAVMRAGQTMGTFVVPVAVEPGAPGESIGQVSVSGGGAAGSVEADMSFRVSSEPAAAAIQAMWAGAFDPDGQPYDIAGGHPASAGTAFRVTTVLTKGGLVVPAGDIRDLYVDLPVGFVGNPLVLDRCRISTDTSTCGSKVGEVAPAIQTLNGQTTDFDFLPISLTKPPLGTAAGFYFPVGFARASFVASVRPDDFGVQVTAPQIPGGYKAYGAVTMLHGSPVGAGAKPFLTNPTECTGDTLLTLMSGRSWQDPTINWGERSDVAPPVVDCESVPFEPAATVAPTASTPDSASGLEFDLAVPQDGLLDKDSIAPSHVRDVVVDLPEGIAVNPSGATGLKGCSDAQMAVGEQSPPQCPDGSKIGTVEVTSPLADHPIAGTMYLGTPKSTDPASGEMLRLFVVARDDDLGIMMKLPGSATADPATGKLTARFENNPRLPFDHLAVELKGGGRGVLATPQTCGDRSIDSTLSPWSGTADVTQSSPFDIAGNCDLGFAPKLAAGMDNQRARGTGTFSFKFSRDDGEQWIDSLTAQLPKGLLASVKDVPLCTSGQAAAGSCPAASRIGTVDATAGSGDPFVLEQKGQAFLTEGYKGCAYGLAVVVPVIAGPFDGSTPETDLGDIVVRQAVCVDRTTAQVSAVSDPLPTIWHGIPLRVRSVTVSVDRPGFMLNPSDCAQNQVDGRFGSVNGANASASSPFQPSGCANLPFKPKLTLALTGRTQVTTGKHPGVKAQVTQQGISEAGIEQAVVRLPKSLALDPENAQALCEFTDGTKPDLENHCPAGSIVGRARAKTPLLRNDLVGNVYFVKNIRIDPNTGNQIRTLPMIIVALRGEIAINLKGESSTTKSGKLVNTFDNIPDAPISQFNLNIAGGQNGILAVTRTRKAKINLCTGRHIAEVDNDGQNGRRSDFDVRMKTPCTKKQTKAAKLQAKRAAAKTKR
jgi:hypothetical protein